MNRTLLQKLYTDPKSGAAFSHWRNLLKAAKKIDRNVTEENVRKFLASKPTHTLYAKTSSKHRKRPITAHFPNHFICIDLMQFSDESIKHNRPYKFLFCSNDVFSRYLNLIPIRSKSIPDVKEALEVLFSKMEEVPKKILSDLEASFYSHAVRDFLKSKNVEIYSQRGASNLKTKNGIVERCQRVIRQLIAKICTEFKQKRFVNYLSYIENIYNSRVNRMTGFAPQVLHRNRSAIAVYQNRILKRDLLPDNTKTKFAVGDFVRYKLVHNTFSKETKKIFSKSIHSITAVKSTNPATFLISPPPSHKKSLYAQDLIKVEFFGEGEKKKEKKNGGGDGGGGGGGGRDAYDNDSQIPIEIVTGAKQLPNGEVLYSCSLIGYDKIVWLSEAELKTRYILFPNSLEKVKKEYNPQNVFQNPVESEGLLTRGRKKRFAEPAQIVTRSRRNLS